MPGLPKGITGKTDTSGNKGEISAFSDKKDSPRRPSDNPLSHPNDGKTGGVPLGKKLTPKGNI